MTPTFFKRLSSIIDMTFYKPSHSDGSEFEEEQRHSAVSYLAQKNSTMYVHVHTTQYRKLTNLR